MHLLKKLPALLLAILLAACGDYSGAAGRAAGDRPNDQTDQGGDSTRSTAAFFKTRVQPGLSVCRTCHVPRATAALSERGKRFMLSNIAGK